GGSEGLGRHAERGRRRWSGTPARGGPAAGGGGRGRPGRPARGRRLRARPPAAHPPQHRRRQSPAPAPASWPGSARLGVSTVGPSTVPAPASAAQTCLVLAATQGVGTGRLAPLPFGSGPPARAGASAGGLTGRAIQPNSGTPVRADSCQKYVQGTGVVTTVYNVQVAEYHTYFVGCEEWGFSAWAHNADACTIRDLNPDEEALLKGKGYTHAVDFNKVGGGKGTQYFRSRPDAEQFALTQRNKLAANDPALSTQTPARGSDRLGPDRSIPEEVQAWDDAFGLDAGKVGGYHRRVNLLDGRPKPLGDATYAAGNYEKSVYERIINGRRIEIHYVKNADTGAIAHGKITNSQIVKR